MLKLLKLFETIVWNPIQEFMNWTDDREDDWVARITVAVVALPSLALMYFLGLLLLVIRKVRR